MKDFKKLPKMACGGGVGKYSEGGDIIAEARAARASGKNTDPAFTKSKPADAPSSNVVAYDRSPVRVNPVAMPNKLGSGNSKINIPGLGEIDRSSIKGLKTGGKTKRGNKK